jgi:hypothetical protein
VDRERGLRAKNGSNGRLIRQSALGLSLLLLTGCGYVALGIYLDQKGSNTGSKGRGPNRAPVVADISVPSSAASGNVVFNVTLSDSHGDTASILLNVEWTDAGSGAPTTQTAVLVSGQTTSLAAEPGGTNHTFVWDSVATLGRRNASVVFKVTPSDADPGAEFTSASFALQNNTPPLATITEPVLNPDDTREIALLVTLFDDESDPVDLQIQWTPSGQAFPALPGQTLEARRVDALGRVEYRDPALPALPGNQLFTPTFAGGLPPTQRGHVFVGKTLEVLESQGTTPIAVTPVLTDPVGLLLEPGELTALIADRAAGAIVRIDLATGAATDLVTGLAGPEFLTLTVDGATLLVSDTASNQLLLFDTVTGAPAGTVGGLTSPRGVAALSPTEAVVADEAGSGRLVLVDLVGLTTTPFNITTSGGLSSPRGLVVDRVHRLAFVAEAGPGGTPTLERLSRFSLDTYQRTILTDASRGGPPRPTALAFAGDHRTLYVTTSEGATSRVFAVNQNNTNRGSGALVASLDTPLGIATDSAQESIYFTENGSLDRLVRYALGTRVAQSTTISAVTLPVLNLSDALSPALSVGARLRVVGALTPALTGLASSPAGIPHRIVVEHPGYDTPSQIDFRVTPSDPTSGAGTSNSTIVPKQLKGVFAPPIILTDGVSVQGRAIALGDLDQDGDDDLVVGYSTNNLDVYFQTAPGSFASPPLSLSHASVVFPLEALIVDLNGDGALDLISANYTSDNVTVFFQTTPGAFASPPLALSAGASGIGPHGVVPADVDGDGDLDVVVTYDATDNAVIFFQTAPGVFEAFPSVLLSDGASMNRVFDAAVGDLNGDGLPDLVTANFQSNNLSVFFQTGGGAFNPTATRLSDGARTNGSFHVEIGDMDGDGDLDIVSVGREASRVTVFTQVTPGNFLPTHNLLASTMARAGSLELGDLDNDGDLDIATSNLDSNNVTLFLQDAGAFSNPPRVLSDGINTSGGIGIVSRDIDGDGNRDLATTNASPADSMAVFLQSSPSTYAAAISLADGTNNNGALDVVAGDLDADGATDLAAINWYPGTVTIFSQKVPGVFAVPPTILSDPALIQPRAIETGDLDADGDLDLAIAAQGSDNYHLFFQTAPGIFSAPTILSDGANVAFPIDVRLSDLDGDGDLDLIGCNRDSDNVTVFVQNPPGSFAQPPLLLGPVLDPWSVCVGDLNGDGLPDLACTSGTGGDLIAVFFQTTPGVFPAAPSITLTGGGMANPVGLVVADLDGDGDNDVACANAASNDLTLFFQITPGTFGPAGSLSDAGLTDYRRLIAADLDGDGDNDLAVATTGFGGKIGVFLQTAPGAFSRPATHQVSAVPFGIVAADLDGDGDLDLATADFSGDRLSIVSKR